MVGLDDFFGEAVGGYAIDISADGSTIIGWWVFVGGNEAFRWTSDTGLVGLGDLPGGSLESPAEDVSGDGTIIVG